MRLVVSLDILNIDITVHLIARPSLSVHLGIPFDTEIHNSFIVVELGVMNNDNAVATFQGREFEVVLGYFRTRTLAIVGLYRSFCPLFTTNLVLVLIVSASYEGHER